VQGLPGLLDIGVFFQLRNVAAHSSGFTEARCPAGWVALSGGYGWGGPDNIISTYPTDGGWVVEIFNNEDISRPLRVFVTCADLP
jgi:hypothetical protein